MRKLLIPKMIEVLVAVVIVTIVSVIWYLIRSTAVLRSSVNLPAAPVHVAPTEGKKKKLQQSQIVLRQAEPRDTLVLFGTTTGNSWQLAGRKFPLFFSKKKKKKKKKITIFPQSNL
jgi:hypothetical protein